LFVERFNGAVGSTEDTEARIKAIKSGYYRHVTLVDVRQRRDGATEIILDWGEDGCRVAEMHRDNQFVGWHFVANRDKCYALSDWREPW
jgi:hypothetical protein